MDFTQQEGKLLHEAGKYRATPWRDKTLLAVLFCAVLGACGMIVVGIMDIAAQRKGLAPFGIGCLFLGLTVQSYCTYILRKRCFLLIQKLQAQLADNRNV